MNLFLIIQKCDILSGDTLAVLFVTYAGCVLGLWV